MQKRTRPELILWAIMFNFAPAIILTILVIHTIARPYMVWNMRILDAVIACSLTAIALGAMGMLQLKKEDWLAGLMSIISIFLFLLCLWADTKTMIPWVMAVFATYALVAIGWLVFVTILAKARHLDRKLSRTKLTDILRIKT